MRTIDSLRKPISRLRLRSMIRSMLWEEILSLKLLSKVWGKSWTILVWSATSQRKSATLDRTKTRNLLSRIERWRRILRIWRRRMRIPWTVSIRNSLNLAMNLCSCKIKTQSWRKRIRHSRKGHKWWSWKMSSGGKNASILRWGTLTCQIKDRLKLGKTYQEHRQWRWKRPIKSYYNKITHLEISNH